MEKETIVKAVKILMGISFVLIILGMIAFLYWVNYSQLSFPVLSSLYWMLLFCWVGIIIYFKWGASVSMVIALTLFIIGSIISTLGLGNLAEEIFRVSFIGWLMGIIHALIEYKRDYE